MSGGRRKALVRAIAEAPAFSLAGAALVAGLSREGGVPANPEGKMKNFTGNYRRILALAAIAAGIALASAGILGGGAESVLRKATLICMECIGIG